MATKDKTEKDSMLSTHNKLKGTICFHISSMRSQAECVQIMLTRFEVASTDEELGEIVKLKKALEYIQSAMNNFNDRTRTKLSIGGSPSSLKNKGYKRKHPNLYG